MIGALASRPSLLARPVAVPAAAPEAAPTAQRSAHAEGVDERQPAPVASTQALDAEEQKEVDRLERRDVEVRQHEQAHAAAGGAHAGAPKYEYETGPDGKRYAVGGSVSIDVSPVRGDPDATIRKMEQVVRAALAPAEPSGPDRSIAASARAKIARARAEMREEQAPESSDDGGAAMRAAGAYAKASVPEAPTSTMATLACQSCGGGH